MTDKQTAFVNEYLIDLNATQAAIRAGYSPNSAVVIGSENKEKPEIKNAIDKAIAERSRRTGITQDRVLQEIAKVAFLNLADLINLDDGSIKADAKRDDTACIASFKNKIISSGKSDIKETEVRLYDKLKALELLGKHLGMFSGQTKQSVDTTLSDMQTLAEIILHPGDNRNIKDFEPKEKESRDEQ